MNALAASAATLATPAWAAPAAAMQRRKIPASGELLPVIGLGTSGSFEVGSDATERAPLAEVLRLLLQNENSVLDTAPSYSTAEQVSGDLLKQAGARKQVFLATKISARSVEEARAQFRQSLQRLQTDKIDLLQVHSLVNWEENLAYMRELKQAGQVRYIGVTHYQDYAHEDLTRTIGSQTLDFVQLNLSVVARVAEQRLLPYCRDRGVAVLINRAFEDGKLFSQVKGKPLPDWAGEIGCTSWGQLFLKFVLGHPAVTAVIPATSKPKNMLDNLGAGIGPMPDLKQRERIAALFA